MATNDFSVSFVFSLVGLPIDFVSSSEDSLLFYIGTSLII